MKKPLRPLAYALASLSLLVGCSETDGRTRALRVTAVDDGTGASLGSVALPVVCGEEAMPHLNRGLALLHNMTYAEAEGEFALASERDPKCVLAPWGMAMSYVHPLWPDVPSDETLERGSNLLMEARERREPSELEDAYLSALEGYYREGSGRSEVDRLASYAAGWESAHLRAPDDLEAQLFRSLGMIAVAASAQDPMASQLEAGQLAEDVLAQVPDHTGALHYIIHAYDLPDLADRALTAARTYGEVAPENSHALHMTSHIFTRVGLWEESVSYNRRAADAALANPINGLTSFQYMHAADYLTYAFLQQLDDQAAQQVWDDMASLEGEVVDDPASAHAFAAVPARLALERQAWEQASNIRAEWPAYLTWSRYPNFVAISEFARGLGAARSGHSDVARTALARLSQLRDPAAALPGQYDWGIQVEIQEVTVQAWIAFEAGDDVEALSLMRRASRLEASTEKHGITPGEVLPAAELLGDMLAEMGQYDEAIEAYESALGRSPNRLNSLYGAGLAAELNGDPSGARNYFARFVDGTLASSTHPRMEHARRFLEGA